jgi:hypothetical protein
VGAFSSRKAPGGESFLHSHAAHPTGLGGSRHTRRPDHYGRGGERRAQSGAQLRAARCDLQYGAAYTEDDSAERSRGTAFPSVVDSSRETIDSEPSADEHIELWGHGGATYEMGVWLKCLTLAQTFGWRPEGYFPTSKPVPTSDGWQRRPFKGVHDNDARAFGAALHRAFEVIMTRSPCNQEQAEAIKSLQYNVDTIRDLANYASMGTFFIPDW